MQELEGRVAVVTGAASGIGLALAKRFGACGMKLVLADVEAAPLSQAAKELEAAGHEVLAIPTDVARFEAVEALAAAAVDRFGTVHVVCNNAGVVTAGPVEKLSLDDWGWVMGVNLWGAIHGVKAFGPILLAQGEGHIVSTASTAGVVAAPAIGPYNVSKFGVVALMETVQKEYASRGVGASVLCPGEVATRITEAERNRPDGMEHAESPAERGFYEAATPMVAAGMDPGLVAGKVERAIRENRFWIFTHPEWKQILRRRVDTLIDEDRLPQGYP